MNANDLEKLLFECLNALRECMHLAMNEHIYVENWAENKYLFSHDIKLIEQKYDRLSAMYRTLSKERE